MPKKKRYRVVVNGRNLFGDETFRSKRDGKIAIAQAIKGATIGRSSSLTMLRTVRRYCKARVVKMKR